MEHVASEIQNVSFVQDEGMLEVFYFYAKAPDDVVPTAHMRTHGVPGEVMGCGPDGDVRVILHSCQNAARWIG